MRERRVNQDNDFWLPLENYTELGEMKNLIFLATIMCLLFFEGYKRDD